MDIPLSRYPASLTAYQLIMTAHDTHHRRSQMTERRAAILCPPSQSSDDPVIQWANEIGKGLDGMAHMASLDPFYPVADAADATMLLAEAAESRFVLFAGHGFATDGWAGLNVGKFYLEFSDVMAHSWAGSLVLLFACESGAIDTSQGDLGRAFLLRGARGVVATTAKVRLDVANFLLHDLFVATFIHGIPVDHAFVRARRRTALFECFKDPRHADLKSRLSEALDFSDKVPAFSLVLDHYGIELDAFISSTGDTIRRKGLTLAGNRRARRALIEAAWTYRYPARVSETLRARLEGLPKPVRDIAWKAQVRLCARYRRLSATGKKLPVVVAAIAREMAAFLWAIGREVAPA